MLLFHHYLRQGNNTFRVQEASWHAFANAMMNFSIFPSNCVQVMVPMMGNNGNHDNWPCVVSQDMVRYTGGLKSDVLVLSGQVKGKTFLPLPSQAAKVAEAADKEQR